MIFLQFYLAYLLVDFVLQPDWIAKTAKPLDSS